MNPGVTEGALEQGEFHLARVDGGHGGVAEAADAKRGLQLHLTARLGPQPTDEGGGKNESGVL